MKHSAKKTVTIIITISLAIILISTIYAMYSISSLSRISGTEYPTVIVDSVAPRRVVGIVVDKNLTVLRLEPGSAAEQAGLEVGDVVVEINGQSVKNVDDVKKEMSDAGIVLPTDSPESAKLSQEVKDATTVAYIESELAAKNMGKIHMDKIVIGVMKGKQKKVTIDIDKKTQEDTANVTPTPVSLDDLYF